MRAILFASAVCLLAESAAAQVEEGPGTPFFFNKPRVTFAAGSFNYHEHDFKIAPGLASRFQEPVFETGLGWDFIFAGHHSLDADFSFFGTDEGAERWREFGTLVQTNRLDVGRFNVGIGYRASTWNRAIPPAELKGLKRTLRFAGGLTAYYRHQAFRRDEFTDFTTSPPTFIDTEVKETFDMAGVEGVAELEFGPRHLAAAFLRGKVGGGYVGVRNDGLEPLISRDGSRIDTSSVHGTVEAGVVSHFAPHVELRLGYRYHHLAVFEKRKTISAVDPVLGPVLVSLELPDNNTQLHVVFFEAAFPF